MVTQITAGDTSVEKVWGRPKEECAHSHVCTPCRCVFGHMPRRLLKMYKHEKKIFKKELGRPMQGGAEIGLCVTLQGAFSFPFPPSHYSSLPYSWFAPEQVIYKRWLSWSIKK